MLAVEGIVDRVDDIIQSLALGSTKKVHFYASAIKGGRHFKMATRDIDKKLTFDSGILAYFNVGFKERTTFYGILINFVYL